jgi:hypothetical protein
MTLPFLYHKNWLNLQSSSDLEFFGRLDIWQYVPLRVANGSTTSGIVINVFAWAENVKLAGPSSGLAVQSNVTDMVDDFNSRTSGVTETAKNLRSDEYGKGPISKVASTVANVSESLEEVPIIGPFAKATSFVSNLVGGIASLFGFTNVPVIDSVVPYKNVPFHAFSSAEQGVPLDKLTLDPKNELSIDPRTVGLPPIDELSFDNIATRKSFLTFFDWSQADTKNDFRFSCNLSPAMVEGLVITGGYELFQTPMGMLSSLYSNWRGEVVFTIKIISSQYHCGALQVTYDPTSDIFNKTDYTGVALTKILDIAKCTEYEIRVPMLQAQNFLRIRPLEPAGGVPYDFSNDKNVGPSSYNPDFHNGRLKISCYNPLTGPSSTADVRVLIFVHCEDLQLNNPSDLIIPVSDFAPQSLSEDYNSYVSQSYKDPVEDKPITLVMGESVKLPPETYSVNFGEYYRSVRPLMRRTTRWFTESVPTSSGDTETREIKTFTITKYPLPYGYDTGGRHTCQNQAQDANVIFNYSHVTPYSILAPCFVGQRGSFHIHANVACSDDAEVNNFFAYRDNDRTGGNLRDSYLTTTNLFGPYAYSYQALLAYKGGVTGMSLVNRRTQTGLEFTAPQFNKFRFVSTNPSNIVRGIDADDTENEKITVGYSQFLPSNTTTTTKFATSVIEFYGEIGTDFTLFYFLNVPVRYIYNTPIPSSFVV